VATVQELLRSGVERLRAAGSETPRLDAELLLGHAINADRTVVVAHPDALVGDGSAERFEADLARRVTGEPVAYIRGFKEFFGLAFAADPRALIPRPETERVVELALAEVMHRLTSSPRPHGSPPLRIVDVGTGGGTIAVALAVTLRKRGVHGDVEIIGTDDSTAALQLARENAVGHSVADRVRFIEADLLPPVVVDPFELVVANLPYVRSDEIDALPIAASFEPRAALDGGEDGLRVIARLVRRLPEALQQDGVAFVEIGADQGDAIGALVSDLLPDWSCLVEADLAGLPRVARIARA
jgi:release factor glutamine methyltransferase